MKNLLTILLSFFSQIFGKKRPQPEPQQKPEILEEDWAIPSVPIMAPTPGQIGIPAPLPTDPLLDLWKECMDYMARQGHVIDREVGGGNIVFVSGHGLDGKKNNDNPDLWTDLCFVARMGEFGWKIPFAAECTTTPGTAPALSKDAKLRGGVARVVPGQYFAWALGFHKKSKYGEKHPAFVQSNDIWISRDFNQDLAAKGDKVYFGWFGINIHAQGEGKDSISVGFNSEGCLVLRRFAELQRLIAIAKDFNCYKQSGKGTIFAATIIEGADLPG